MILSLAFKKLNEYILWKYFKNVLQVSFHTGEADLTKYEAEDDEAKKKKARERSHSGSTSVTSSSSSDTALDRRPSFLYKDTCILCGEPIDYSGKNPGTFLNYVPTAHFIRYPIIVEGTFSREKQGSEKY